jgi:hypothetical protein
MLTDKEIESIYKKSLAQRQRPKQDPILSLGPRLRDLIVLVAKLYETPSVPKQKIDEIERQVSNYMNWFVMNTNPAVIQAIQNKAVLDAMRKKLEKMKEE